MKVGTFLPEEVKSADFIGSESISFDSPLLVHFWAMSCPSCHGNMPHLQTLRDSYRPKGLQTIAVHMPRGPFDLDVDEVRASMTELGVTEPCAIDNEHEIGDAFGVDAWPTYFLFGADGYLKRHAKGNFGVRMIEQALIRIFDETTEVRETALTEK